MRIVSLVPSLTETIAGSPGSAELVGCTDWCTHPANLDVPRIGGTKNPDVAAVIALRPDIVVANEEENREVDVTALREHGIEVCVTEIRSVDEAFTALAAMLQACELPRPGWLDDAQQAFARLAPVAERELEALIPIWRRPWMAVGRDTFAGDLLARLGVRNVLSDSPDRYPRFDPTDYHPTDYHPTNASGDRVIDLVVLPDEPYRFTATDGPEAFPGVPAALVDGRSLTWYGPSLVEAPHRLRTAIETAIDSAIDGR